MVAADGDAKAPHPPDVEDLKRLCRSLNDLGARYVVVGGFAVNYYGLTRATEDIDLLVDPSPENISAVKRALSIFEDNAAAELAEDELERYVVVRVVDEVTVDLIARIGDVTFQNAGRVWAVLDGVRIPIADLDTLIATKQSVREKDRLDLAFLIRVREAERGFELGE